MPALGVVGAADGLNDLASTTGWFGKGADGHERGAYGLLNDSAKEAGAGVTNAVDGVLGHDGLGGAIGEGLGAAVHYGGDFIGLGAATTANVVAGIAGGAKKLWDWL